MNKISFCKPFVGEEEAQAAYNAVKSGWITTGKITEEVEHKITNYTGAKYCVLLTSCTAALHLSLEYLKRFKLKDRFRVLVPSMTFSATVTEVVNSGGEVVFGDVNKDTLCLERPKHSNFDVAIPVHLYGIKADTNYDCQVIEDSAHLIEKNQCKDNPNLVCFSFYATKNLTMGEGGAICTNDEKAYNWLKQARHHGIGKDGWKRYEDAKRWKYDMEFVGWKYNPSDVLAAILNVNLDKIDVINKERKRCVDLYNKLLGYNNKGLHLYRIFVDKRDEFMEYMNESGVSCSCHFLPVHQMSIFKDRNIKLPITEWAGEHLVSLPLFPGLKDEEIRYIVNNIKKTGLLLYENIQKL